jgi:iron-regulated transporter 1
MLTIQEYFAIAQVYSAVPGLASRNGKPSTPLRDIEGRRTPSPDARGSSNALQQWKAYFLNPACLASFSLALLYFTVLGFGSQLTTYLLTLGFTSTHIAGMRLVSVILELSATCAAPLLMRRIGAVRAGLWFINYQLTTVLLAIALFTLATTTQAAGLALVAGVTLSRLGLWGFDLCVQYLVQADAPEASRGSFSAIEASLQNLFELCSFATTMVWARPGQFRFPVWVSGGVVCVSAACFAAFVRGKRGHLLHTSRCLEKRSGKYRVLPTIEEESEVELEAVGRACTR